MYDELVKRLRASCEDCKLWDGDRCCLKGDCTAQTRLQAADAIEELSKRVPPVPHGRRVVYRGDVYNAIEAKRIKTLDRVLNDRYIEGMHDGLKQALFALATVEDAPTIIPGEEGET